MKSWIIAGMMIAAPAHASDMLSNRDFSGAPNTTVLTAVGTPAQSAAPGWSMWNNTATTTTSTLMTSFQGRGNVLHIVTGDQLNGAVQVFNGLAYHGYADIWVASGRAMYLAALGGSGISYAATSTTGAWERVFIDTTPDGFDEVTLYSFAGAADFYVSGTSATADPPAVPEPSSWAMLLVGFGAAGHALRRRSAAVRYSASGRHHTACA